jgi:protein gp37
MSSKSAISWTDATWNPVVGCTPISEGCRNCYAARMATRWAGKPGKYRDVVRDGKWTGMVRCVPEALGEALKWKKPRRVFVCSMSDLFHPAVPFEFLDEVFAAMALAEQHKFLVLTKRPDRMAQYLDRFDVGWPVPMMDANGGVHSTTYSFPLVNVALAISAEDQKTLNERVPHLLRCPAAKRFLSLEPLLEEINLNLCAAEDAIVSDQEDPISGKDADGKVEHSPVGYVQCMSGRHWELVSTWHNCGVNLIIVGGETGPRARPMHPDWVRSIRDQCVAAGVPFHFKAWGEWAPWDDGQRQCTGNAKHMTERIGVKAAGRLLDGREWNGDPWSDAHA